MYDAVLRIIRLGISIGEVWLCYQLMYLMILEKEYLRKKDKVIIWGNILILGYLLGVNRSASFFSHVMFLFCIIVTISCVWIVNWKALLLIVSVVLLYYTVISLLDFVLAFISMELLKKSFANIVFVHAKTWWPIVIYGFSRLLIGGIIFGLYRKTEDIHRGIKEIKNILVVLGIILCILLRCFQVMMDGMVSGIWEMRGGVSGLSMLIMIIVIFGGGMISYKYKIIKEEKEVLLLREKMMQKKFQDMVTSQQNLHDMKNHLVVLRMYERGREWEKLQRYLEDISGNILDASAYVWTGNTVIDLILNQKMIEAKEKGIDMYIWTVPILDFPCTESENISLFGNILDNAIEACEQMIVEKRWIELKIEKQNQLIFIEANNSIGCVPINKGGVFITSKKDVKSHGYGLKGIERIVNRHEGTFSCQVKEKQFCVKVSFFENGESNRL